MRIWHKHLLPYLPDLQFKGQLRELVSIMHDWKNWNVKKIWTPNEKGLGMRFVFEQVNQIYGKDFIKF